MSRGATPPEHRVPIPVDLEQLGGDGDARILLAQARKVLPVNRAAVSAEQIGPGKQVRSSADRPERYAPLGEPAQPGDAGFVDMVLDPLACAHEDEIGVLGRSKVSVDLHDEAVAACNRHTSHAHDSPSVQRLTAHPVRHPQRLQRAAERDEGILGNECEDDLARLNIGARDGDIGAVHRDGLAGHGRTTVRPRDYPTSRARRQRCPLHRCRPPVTSPASGSARHGAPGRSHRRSAAEDRCCDPETGRPDVGPCARAHQACVCGPEWPVARADRPLSGSPGSTAAAACRRIPRSVHVPGQSPEKGNSRWKKFEPFRRAGEPPHSFSRGRW